jgi:hypothetical protein
MKKTILISFGILLCLGCSSTLKKSDSEAYKSHRTPASDGSFDVCSLGIRVIGTKGSTISNLTAPFKLLTDEEGAVIYDAVIGDRHAYIIHNSGKLIDVTKSTTANEVLGTVLTPSFYTALLKQPGGGGSSSIIDAAPLGPLFRSADITSDAGVFAHVVGKGTSTQTLLSFQDGLGLKSNPDLDWAKRIVEHISITCPNSSK